MGQSITYKILAEHLVEGALEPGREIGIRIAQTLTQDATGTMAFLQFESMGVDRVRNELAVSYVDHNTIQVGPENADDHAYLQSAAARFGVVFSRPGNGICHQLHLERFGMPGKTLLGSDSHTPTGGGLGMIAIGAGGLDVAMAMGGAPFYLTAPRVIRVELTGRLKPWVSAKDVILKVLEIFSTKGNVGCVLEYAGPGVKTLSVPERATITNMGAECGVTTSVFPSDAVTRDFLTAQGRADGWRELLADPDAEYDRTVRINLSQVEPLAALPHSPGNIKRVAELAGTPVTQVLIGSCTNSSYRDLKTVAKILQGRTVHPNVSLGIAPGSRQVMRMLADEGLLGVLIASGARLLENACGFCIGNSMSPATGAVSLRTSNRNFEGRSGTTDAGVYLVSPEVAALGAIAGRIVDPLAADAAGAAASGRSAVVAPGGGGDAGELEFGVGRYPRVREPRVFTVDDSMFIRPSADGRGVSLVKGPNIGSVPRGQTLPEALRLTVAICVGDKITTDHIMPAGQRLKYRSNIAKYATYVFEGVDAGFAKRAAANRDAGVANLIVAGESYGQGSSREHAAMCPMFLGVRAVVAKSIERIHMANLINFGILPLIFADPAGYERFKQGEAWTLLKAREVVAGTAPAVLVPESGGAGVAVRLELSDRQKKMLLAGGLLNTVGQ